MGKNSIERILYLDELLRDRKYPKKRQIAARFEVSNKTIERDIDYMRDRLGAPISYDRLQGGYMYEEDGYFLPAIHMQQDEAFALFLSHYLGNAWKGTPLADAADSLWSRLSGLMQEDILVDTAAFSETVFLIDQSVIFDPQIWVGIYTAIRSTHKILIWYKTPEYDNAVERTLQPFRLINHRNGWYVLGFDEYRQKPLIFSLSRIQRITVLEDKFSFPKEFNIEDYIDPVFGLHIGGEAFKVTIIADKPLSTILNEHVSVQNKQVTSLEDGTYSISFETTQREELKHWLLQWGRHIELIEPEWMREELADIGEYFLKTYRFRTSEEKGY